MRTITADNGTEFHWYGRVEAVNPVKFYFATPHHSWERGTNENNGLIRQYLPKGQSMARVTQSQCDLIASWFSWEKLYDTGLWRIRDQAKLLHDIAKDDA